MHWLPRVHRAWPSPRLPLPASLPTRLPASRLPACLLSVWASTDWGCLGRRLSTQWHIDRPSLYVDLFVCLCVYIGLSNYLQCSSPLCGAVRCGVRGWPISHRQPPMSCIIVVELSLLWPSRLNLLWVRASQLDQSSDQARKDRISRVPCSFFSGHSGANILLPNPQFLSWLGSFVCSTFCCYSRMSSWETVELA